MLGEGVDFSKLKNAFKNLKEAIEHFGNGSFKILNTFFDEYLVPMSQWTLNDALPRFLNMTADAIKAIDFNKINAGLSELYKVLTPFTKNVIEGVLFLYEKILLPIGTWTANELLPAFLKDLTVSINALNGVINTFKPAVNYLFEKFLKPIGQITGSLIINTLNGMANAINKVASTKSGLVAIGTAIGLITLKMASNTSTGHTLISMYNKLNNKLYDTKFFNYYISGIDKIEKGLKGLKQTILHPISSFDKFKNKIKEVFSNVGSSVGTGLGKITSDIKNAGGIWSYSLNGANKIWSSSFNGMKNVISSWGNSTKSGITKVMNGIGAGFQGLGAIIASNPLGIIITVVGVIISQSEALQKTLATVLEVIQPLFDLLGGILSTILQPLIPLLKLIADGINFILKPVVLLADITANVTSGLLGLFGIKDNQTSKNARQTADEVAKLKEAEENLNKIKKESAKTREQVVEGLRKEREQLVSNGEGYGGLTAKYDEAIEKSDNFRKEIDRIIEVEGLNEQQIKILEDKYKEYTDSLKENLDIQKQVRDIENESVNAKLKVMDAEDRLTEKQKRLNEVIKKYGPESREAKRASLELEDASFKLQAAQDAQKDKQLQLNEVNKKASALNRENKESVNRVSDAIDNNTNKVGKWAEENRNSTRNVMNKWQELKDEGSNSFRILGNTIKRKNDEISNSAYNTFNNMMRGTQEYSNKIAREHNSTGNSTVGFLRKIVSSYNRMVDGINRFKISLPSWVPIFGGHSFNIRIPKIPMFERGTIANRPTPGIFGENGTEMVLPLEKHLGWMDKIASGIYKRMSSIQVNKEAIKYVENRENNYKQFRKINNIFRR